MTTRRIDIPSLDATAAATGEARQGVGRLVLGAICLMAAAALLDEAINATIPATAVVWGGLALGSYIYGLLFVLLAVRGPGYGPASWRLGAWMMIWAGATYGPATVLLGQSPNTETAQIVLVNVIRALWLVAAGMTMWFAGYLVGPGRLFRRAAGRGVEGLRRRFSADVRSPLTPWLLYGIGTLARITSAVATGRIGYVGNAASAVSTAAWYGQIIMLLGLCGQVGVAVAALQVFRERLGGARITLIILFLAEVGYAIASGQKQSFATTILAVAIPYTAARNRLPKAMLVTVGVIFLAIIIPFTASYRSTVRQTTGDTLSAGQAVGTAPQILRSTFSDGDSPLTVVPRSVTYLLARGQAIDGPAIIMQRTPGQIPYSDPAQIITGPLSALIPRVLWPGKPILATGYQFGQAYFEIPSTVYSATAITPIGDLYRYGGWVPVLIGMFVLGCGVRLLDDFLDVQGNPHTVFLTLFLFPGFVTSEQDWTTLLAAVPAFILLWWFTVAFAFRRQRRIAT